METRETERSVRKGNLVTKKARVTASTGESGRKTKNSGDYKQTLET